MKYFPVVLFLGFKLTMYALALRVFADAFTATPTHPMNLVIVLLMVFYISANLMTELDPEQST